MTRQILSISLHDIYLLTFLMWWIFFSKSTNLYLFKIPKVKDSKVPKKVGLKIQEHSRNLICQLLEEMVLLYDYSKTAFPNLPQCLPV